jgi:glucosyl-dolichyl phosphate glucuronosyltransferase
MSSPTISVIICVYTEARWTQIRAAIDSVDKQTLPALETIVVVDHNPKLYKRLVDIETSAMVVENREEQGLSGGRNTGAALAKGEIIAYLDDDAAADPDWLKYLIEGYGNPAVKGVGGFAEPDWQTARPAWMPEEFYWVVGCNYRGMAPSGAPVRNLIGSNMSFRREVFDLVGGFQTGVGRNADSLPLGCEETLFCIKVGQQSPGSLFVLEYRARVRHYVTDSRCRFSYFVSRCYAEGVSKAQVTAYVGNDDGLAAERSYTTRTLPLGAVRGIADLFRGDLSGPARSAAIVVGLCVTAAGYLRTSLKLRRRA